MLNTIYLCPFHFVTLFNFMPSYFIYSFPLLYFVSINRINLINFLLLDP